MRRAGKLLNCPRALMSCFKAYVFSSLKYCALVWMSSAESHLCLLDSIVRSAESCVRGICVISVYWIVLFVLIEG